MAEELDVEILKEEHLSNPEAYRIIKEVVNKVQKAEGSVPLLLMKTLTHLSKFAERITPEEAKALKKALRRYGLKDETIIMIINTCPETLDELRILFELEEKVVDTDTANEILDLIKSYCHEE